jgi:hypothetical protein
MEFEDIYREEAKERQASHGKLLKIKQDESCSIGTGLARLYMARDSAASEHSVQRVLYIKLHDPDRFGQLKGRAAARARGQGIKTCQ